MSSQWSSASHTCVSISTEQCILRAIGSLHHSLYHYIKLLSNKIGNLVIPLNQTLGHTWYMHWWELPQSLNVTLSHELCHNNCPKLAPFPQGNLYEWRGTVLRGGGTGYCLRGSWWEDKKQHLFKDGGRCRFKGLHVTWQADKPTLFRTCVPASLHRLITIPCRAIFGSQLCSVPSWRIGLLLL